MPPPKLTCQSGKPLRPSFGPLNSAFRCLERLSVTRRLEAVPVPMPKSGPLCPPSTVSTQSQSLQVVTRAAITFPFNFFQKSSLVRTLREGASESEGAREAAPPKPLSHLLD